MKNLKKISKENLKTINGGFSELQVETCGSATNVCFQTNRQWGCRAAIDAVCYPPMI